MNKCKNCGKEYTAIRASKVFCDDACRKAFNKTLSPGTLTSGDAKELKSDAKPVSVPKADIRGITDPYDPSLTQQESRNLANEQIQDGTYELTETEQEYAKSCYCHGTLVGVKEHICHAPDTEVKKPSIPNRIRNAHNPDFNK